MEQTTLRETTKGEHKKEQEEEAQAAIDIWKYVFGFTDMAVIRCAIELGIGDMLERNGGSMSLSELSSSLECPTPYLYRIMRYLVHRNFFKQNQTTQNTLVYTQKPLSRRLLSHGEGSFADFLLFQSSPVMLAPWLALNKCFQEKINSPFEAVHGKSVWSYAEDDSSLNKLINNAMACDAKLVVPQIIKECHDLFDGVHTVVEVGGGNGTSLSKFTDAFPWLQGINFDLPHVVAEALPCERVEHVGGNMFNHVPKADVVLMKFILHDWGDEECIQILKNCKEAIPKDKGKVIIVDAIIGEEGTEDKFHDAKMLLDMVMIAQTTGKERSLTEWNDVIKEAGFSHLNVKPIQALQSVIEVFP